MPALLSILILLMCQLVFPQNMKQGSGDLQGAIPIELNRDYKFPLSPKGPGTIQEFPEEVPRSSIWFKKERNSVWFVLNIPYDGELTFEIVPEDPHDDYDWMLFRHYKQLGEDLRKNKIKPLRSNISRNDLRSLSKTGLRTGYQNEHAVAGPGKSFSKPLKVRQGNRLALVIDNIYDGGKGFSFRSKLSTDIRLDGILSGTISSQDSLPLAGEILCEDDSTGLLLVKSRVGANGEYNIRVPRGRPVNLIARAPGYVFQDADVILLKKEGIQDFYLVPVQNNARLVLFNIHFAPDNDQILSRGLPELNRLVEFLKEHTNYNARIIGHTNNNPFASAKYLQRLSFSRAIAVKKYLLQSGIPEDRLSCAGMGGKQPFVITKDPEEGLKNLRVEVVLEEK